MRRTSEMILPMIGTYETYDRETVRSLLDEIASLKGSPTTEVMMHTMIADQNKKIKSLESALLEMADTLEMIAYKSDRLESVMATSKLTKHSALIEQLKKERE